jgi:predicted ATPase/DNA-binding winged helix-turn-helix (wHTH) protein
MRPRQIAFGPFRIDPSAQRLWRGTEPLPLTPKPVSLLHYFVQNAGRLVTKEELLAHVWPGVHVSEAVLKNTVASVRLALGDSADAHAFIETEPRRGYRFVARVDRAIVPEPLCRLLGRRVELAEAKRLVARHRLVTLTGPPGCGKTRLAVALALRLRDEEPNAVECVDLRTAAPIVAIERAMADGLAVTWSARARAVPAGASADRGLLLVLNDCDRHIHAIARVAEHLLRDFPRLRLLATCRSPLVVPGEQLMEVPPLEVPATDLSTAHAHRTESVRLFLARAIEAQRSFSPSSLDIAAVASICRRLDGLPIAIESAAACVKMLAPVEIFERLYDLLVPLGSAREHERSPHRSMCALFERSVEPLSPDECELLRRLSWFTEPFTLEAAERVWATAPSHTRIAAIEVMAGLVNRSLVALVRSPGPGPSMFRMIEPLRQYANRRLIHAGV